MYVYNLPPKYNNDWLSNPRCKNHLFASEVAIHKALSTSQFRTLDPTEADFFFIPVYVSCNFSTVNGFPAIGHARALISSAVQLISSEHPFWNQSRGSDHVFVASHDYGACFHAMVSNIFTFLYVVILQNLFNFQMHEIYGRITNYVASSRLFTMKSLFLCYLEVIFSFFKFFGKIGGCGYG